jgi:hypothetical protein
VVTDAAAEEGGDAVLVLGSERIEVRQQRHLVHRRGQVERRIEDLGGDVGEQRVDVVDPDRLQRPPNVVGGVRNVRHDQPSSATAR